MICTRIKTLLSFPQCPLGTIFGKVWLPKSPWLSVARKKQNDKVWLIGNTSQLRAPLPCLFPLVAGGPFREYRDPPREPAYFALNQLKLLTVKKVLQIQELAKHRPIDLL